MRRICRPPCSRQEGTPTTGIIRGTSKRERGGLAQSKAQERPSVIPCTPGTLTATTVADTATASAASAVNIDTIAASTGETEATAHDWNLASETFSVIFDATVAHAAASNLTDADATAHDSATDIAANVADTATASAASAVDIVRPNKPLSTDRATDVTTSSGDGGTRQATSKGPISC